MVKNCKECRNVFVGKPEQTFCSKICRGLSDRKKSRVSVECSACGNSFEKIRSQALRSLDHYCSTECKSEHYKIKFASKNNPHWKEKTSEIACTSCQKLFLYRDYHKANDKFCSVECKAVYQKSSQLGESNPNYKRNKSDYMRLKERKYTGYKEWRMEVFRRDNFNCLKCKTNTTVDNRLVAHHIQNHYSFEEGRIDVNNGVTLCSKCHWNFHTLYGTLHNNQQQLDEFLYITN